MKQYGFLEDNTNYANPNQERQARLIYTNEPFTSHFGAFQRRYTVAQKRNSYDSHQR